ncbi:MAG: hypothetical protein C5B56_15090, partial [Proteobacteria bacterium]
TVAGGLAMVPMMVMGLTSNKSAATNSSPRQPASALAGGTAHDRDELQPGDPAWTAFMRAL